MKKVLISVFISILLVSGFISPAFCDTYVPSIMIRDDAELISDPIIVEPDECKYELVVSPYIKKDEIQSEQSKQELKEAYAQIYAANDVSELVPERITEIAHEMGVETEDLVVRDLFDVSEYHIGTGERHDDNLHEEKVYFEIKVQDLSNYVCLLVYHDGEWKVVEDVIALYDDNVLEVLTSELSPFALVVAIDFKYTASAHGCIWHLYICITMIITFLVTNIVRSKDSETREKKKKNILFRDIICLISLILSIIFYIFGTCKYDIYALIIDILIVIITFIYSHPKYNKDER